MYWLLILKMLSNVESTPPRVPIVPPSGSVNGTIKAVINVLSVITGAAAVIMIIIGGFRYVTSGGNPETTKGARNTIIYAVIGIVVVAVSQLIVHFVLNTIK
jgi:hypothetical protein